MRGCTSRSDDLAEFWASINRCAYTQGYGTPGKLQLLLGPDGQPLRSSSTGSKLHDTDVRARPSRVGWVCFTRGAKVENKHTLETAGGERPPPYSDAKVANRNVREWRGVTENGP